MKGKDPAAVELGRRGGKVRTAAKTKSSRENASRPRTGKHPCPKCGYAARETAGGFTCKRCRVKWSEKEEKVSA